ncbi:hypothetical protein DFJ58DRAFT_735465 [Suillus subalutaceus]|uniref:uncharacterized protein n=1 Tax=Suillus subalutaceus TaxID=48586 RepID=UPI001B85C9E4|nr:uncharacterized protein DFJ58DRAFT_735465 [Suillus subalutaceus]KAG1835815.1 hypothetical protein DFJ58DRAFT_735465 [Suillus subalutaceus]
MSPPIDDPPSERSPSPLLLTTALYIPRQPSPPPQSSSVTIVKTEPHDNFMCRNCNEIGHRHKNCPTYFCCICRNLVPGHLSVFCKDLKGEKPIPLVWTDAGFYEALSRWERLIKTPLWNRSRSKKMRGLFVQCAGDRDNYDAYDNLIVEIGDFNDNNGQKENLNSDPIFGFHHMERCFDELDEAELALAIFKYKHAIQTLNLSDFSDADSDSDSGLDMLITPPSPLTPQLSEFLDSDSDDEITRVTAHYDRINDTITSLRDEVSRACVLQKPDAPPMQAPQIHLLHDFGTSRAHLLWKKLRVNPEIFDDILDHISGRPIFTNQSNNP